MKTPGCPHCGGIAICLITEQPVQGEYTKDYKIERRYYKRCPDCQEVVYGAPHKRQLPAYKNFWVEVGVIV